MHRIPSWITLCVYLLSAGLYIWLLYDVPRHEFGMVYGVLFALFGGYFFVLFRSTSQSFSILPDTSIPNPPPDIWHSPQSLIIAGLSFRLIALFALPQLSDDYFRFVWDGRLLSQGINPFLQLPSELMASPEEAASLGLTEELYEGLNSKNYFTIYPPILQGIFSLGASLFPKDLYGHVLLMKCSVYLAEAASLLILLRLLRHMQLPLAWIGIYALNPLTIVELCGNLHFEALMIVGLLWAIWELRNNRWLRATIPFAIAVGSKLLPLMLLPLLIRRLGCWRAIAFGAIVVGLTTLMFLPILDLDTFLHLSESVGLYFQSFEFNASIYYLVRWVGYQFTGYNIIQSAGPWLAISTIAGILLLSWREQKDNLSRSMMWVFLIYFSLSSIVHPWYSISLIALCVCTPYRFPIIWSVLIPVSYATYRTTEYIQTHGLDSDGVSAIGSSGRVGDKKEGVGS